MYLLPCICVLGSGVHSRDARESNEEVLWGVESESVISQVGVVRGCGYAESSTHIVCVGRCLWSLLF